MQWSCPHCGIILAVANDVLGTGWSFSRCYKCGGFALIRRAEVNIIKVDKAPPGEKIILPEASNDPTINLMNEEATKKAAQYIQKPIGPAGPAPVSTSPAPVHIMGPPPFLHSPQHFTTMDISRATLPEPLPEISGPQKKSGALPFGISAATVLMVVSGAYLYIQGQALWTKTRELATKATFLSIPATPGTPENLSVIASIAPPTSMTDQVQISAMAPEKPIESMTPKTTPVKPLLMVQIRSEQANLHSGPGLQFPIVGIAIPSSRYQVAEWNNRWFKILIQKPKDLSGKSEQGTGWIRNDLVQVIPPGIH